MDNINCLSILARAYYLANIYEMVFFIFMTTLIVSFIMLLIIIPSYFLSPGSRVASKFTDILAAIMCVSAIIVIFVPVANNVRNTAMCRYEILTGKPAPNLSSELVRSVKPTFKED